MAAKFLIKGDDPQFSVMPNAIYGDLYDNNLTTADIQSGTVDNVRKNTLFLTDFNLPAKPTFGDAKLTGAKAGFYINDIDADDGSNSIGLRAYKLRNEIGNREGGKSSGTGTLISNEDIVVISGFHKSEANYEEENFTGPSTDSSVLVSKGAVVINKDDPYLTKEDGYDYGQRFGGKSTLFTTDRADHFEKFGATRSGIECYPIHKGQSDTYTYYTDNTTPNRFDMEVAELYHTWDIEAYDDEAGMAIIKYAKETPLTFLEGRQTLSTKDSIFDRVKEDLSFHGANPETGEMEEAAYAHIKLSSDQVRGKGSSLHFDSRYPHRFNTPGTEVYYPERRYDGTLQDGSSNHQVSWVSKALPTPVHLYSREPTATADGRQPVPPTIEIDLKIDEIAPILIRDQNSLVAEPDHDYRLSRSIVVTFGEEEPRHYDNLMTYVRRHTPNANADGSNTGEDAGDGSSAKSFYGLALVKHDGELCYYNLGNNGKHSSTYTDTTYGLDTSTGEVCFGPAPTALDKSPIGAWVRLAIQMHPDDEGAYWCMYEPDTGELFSANDPYTSGKLRNTKVSSESGTKGINADNLSDFPKFMTIWCNNYQAIKGDFNTDAGLWETGLVAANSSTSLQVYGVSATGAVNDGTMAGVFAPSYLLLDRGADITFATSDGSSAADTYVTENPGTVSSGLPVLTINSASGVAIGDRLYYQDGGIPDTQITSERTDCNMSFYIDSVRLKYFNLLHSNATVRRDMATVGRIDIPSTAKLPNTAWQDGSSTVTNVYENSTQQPSYICLGFDSITDISTADYEGEIKTIFLNEFDTENARVTGNIVTNQDSDVSNIRVGFTSAVENYGRQGAASSTRGDSATIHPDIGNGESPNFSNAEGTPSYLFRGLEVGDLDTANNSFSVEADGSGSDGVGNADYFTQKGMMKFIAGIQGTLRRADSGSNIAKADASALGAGETSVKVTDADDFVVNGYIQIVNEIIKVTSVNSGTNVIGLSRGQGATDAVEHPHDTDIFLVAFPEKRECIFASARITGLGAGNRRVIKVDDPSIFANRDNEDYILYKYNDTYANPTGMTGFTFKVEKIDGNTVTLNENHYLTIRDDDTYFYGKYLISPYKYWLMIETLNMTGQHGWQDDTSGTTKYLPAKSYKNCVQIHEKGNYGATFNESLYNDGRNVNTWNLDIFNTKDDGIVSLQDYGLGAYDKEKSTGGHIGYKPISIANDDDKYIEIDFNNVITVDKLEPNDTLPILLTNSTPTDNAKINIDTEDGTNKPYLLGIFEDPLPVVNNFAAKPNEDNPFNIDFTWDCADPDLWYGFIMVDDKHVHSQYNNAVLHYPMNEAGSDGDKATAPVDQIQNMTTAVDAGSTTGPFYDIQGLAGNCLRMTTAGTASIDVGTGSADPLASTGFSVTDEMTINVHFTPDLDADGTLSTGQMLLFSNQRFYLQIQTDGTLRYVQYWDTNSAIRLTSSTKVPLDGKTPTNVMITFDANLTSGNVKMFVNGKLEDLTGEVLTADNDSTTNTGWYFQQEIEHNNNKIFIGNQGDSLNVEFTGRLEELVIYNKCLYPVNVKDGKFTFTKPLKEVNETASSTPSKSYTARLFVKDYHNIRGSTADEVACSAPVSIRKAAFRFNNS